MNRSSRLLGALWLVTACQPDRPVNEAGDSSTETTTSESSGEESTDGETSSESGTDTTDTTDSTDTTDDTETGEDPICGNGVLEADEACDDGNDEDGDDCTNACTLPTCGDGIVQAGEGCDDGNAIDDDACTNACIVPTCGNGMLDDGEECEDGNSNPTDGCTDACLFATCGDGVVWEGYETCDDANMVDEDACTNACELASCGDDFVQPGEECEDGNEAPNDGCFGCLAQRVLQVSISGGGHACALLDTGAVRCWGEGSFGRLGYGNTEHIGDNELPFSAGDVNVGGTVVQITTGDAHTCALLDTGTIRCWGWGLSGRLGYGNEDNIGDNEDPATAGDVNVGGSVVQVSAGGTHTCALLDTGAVRCWGQNYTGQLGYGSTTEIGDDEEPSAVGDVDLGGLAVQLSVGSVHTCVLMADTGGVKCWGQGEDGRLGYASQIDVGIVDVPADWGELALGGSALQVSAGYEHTCALLEGNDVRCWGEGGGGALGYGNSLDVGDNETPAQVGVVNVGGPVITLDVGTFRTCARLDTDAVRCWGRADDGALGYGNNWNIGDNEAPASAGDVNVGGPVDFVSVGYGNTCALLESGTVRCWGANSYGVLGYGHVNEIGDNELPFGAGNVQIF